MKVASQNMSLRLQALIDKYRPYLANTLLKAATWYVIGNAIEKAVYVLGVVLFTRILVPEEYGTVSLFTTWTSIFMIVFSFNLFPALRRIYHDHEDTPTYADHISSALLFGLSTILILILIGMMLPEAWFTTLFSLEKPYIILAGVAILFEYPMRVIRTVWVEDYSYKSSVIFSLLLAILHVALSVVCILLIPILFGDSLAKEYGRAWGIIFANIILLLFMIPNRHYIGKLRLNWHYIKIMLIFSVPMIPHALSSVVLGQFDRIIIDSNFGRYETGLYSYGYQIGLIAMMITVSANRAWSPWFMQKLNNEQHELLHKRNQQYLQLMTILIGFTVLISPILVRIIAPSEYYEATAITPIIVGSTYFFYLYTMLSTYLMYEKKTGLISFGTVAAGALNIVLNIILIPQYGYIIAAWTTLISYAFLFAIYLYICHQALPQTTYLFRIIPMVIYSVIICIVSFVISTI